MEDCFMELKNVELEDINGGGKISEALGYAAGWLLKLSTYKDCYTYKKITGKDCWE